MDFDREQVVTAFLAESEEGLQAMEQQLMALESGSSDPELLDGIFRVVHTIKGNASALDFPELAGFAHVIEDLLDLVRNHQMAIQPALISLVLSAVDALRALVPAAGEGNDNLSDSHRQIKARIMELASGARTQEPSRPEEGPSPQAVAVSSPQGTRNRTLRVDVAKLDQMLNLTGEIAITQGRLRRMIEDLGIEKNRDILDMQRESERLYKDLQEQVMGIRMVPVGPLFQQFVRSVRDISQSHNKLARLEVIGADVEVDTRVLEHLKDPLLHMIRNAVDHGIETPDERHAKGKSACGSLTLKAFHRAGNIFIQLSDDGAGFDRQRILDKAKSLGIVQDGERLSEKKSTDWSSMPASRRQIRSPIYPAALAWM